MREEFDDYEDPSIYKKLREVIYSENEENKLLKFKYDYDNVKNILSDNIMSFQGHDK